MINIARVVDLETGWPEVQPAVGLADQDLGDRGRLRSAGSPGEQPQINGERAEHEQPIRIRPGKEKCDEQFSCI